MLFKSFDDVFNKVLNTDATDYSRWVYFLSFSVREMHTQFVELPLRDH